MYSRFVQWQEEGLFDTILKELSEEADFQDMNAAYAKFFNAPYPVRATFIAGIIVPGARIEILAQADVSHVKN